MRSSPSNPSTGVLAWVGEISPAVALCGNQAIASVRSQVMGNFTNNSGPHYRIDRVQGVVGALFRSPVFIYQTIANSVIRGSVS